MTHEEVISCIKDSIFEGVMSGTPLPRVLLHLHYFQGYKREDVLEAFEEMKKEAEQY